MIAALALQNVQAEITCASCPSPVQLHMKEFQLGMRTGPTDEPGPLKNIRVEFRQLGVTGQNVGADDGRETASAEGGHQSLQDVSLDGVSTEADPPGSSKQSVDRHQGGQPELRGDAARQRAKRSGPDLTEFSDGAWVGRSGVDAAATSEDRGSFLDGHQQGRPEFRWNRDEDSGNNRQDEPKLSSSTFALTGDSAHNHAVVYWSGFNSSVSKAGALFSLPTPLHVTATSHGVLRAVSSSWWRSAVTHRAETLCSVVPLTVNRCTGSYRCAPTRTGP